MKHTTLFMFLNSKKTNHHTLFNKFTNSEFRNSQLNVSLKATIQCMQDSITTQTISADSIPNVDSLLVHENDSIYVLANDSLSGIDSIEIQTVVIDQFKGSGIRREIKLDNWSIISLLSAIVLLGVAININSKLWSHNMQSIWNQATADRVFRERTNQNNFFNVLIEILSYLSLTILYCKLKMHLALTYYFRIHSSTF